MYLKEFNLSKNDYYYLFAILLLSLILSIYYINFNINLGIYCSDVYIYLLNALYFTGTNINSTQTIYLSPVICFLTSILFNLGLKDKIAILIITTFFAVLGNIGFYLLLKQKFNELLSSCGVILYLSFAINLTWFGNGSIDLAASSITIWTVLLAIISIQKNPKYYQILIPLFVIGFFTRYTVILIFPVLVLYYLYYNGFKFEKNDLKYILRGLVFGTIVSILIIYPILLMGNGNFAVSSQIGGGMTGNKGSVQDLAYNSDVSYYLVNFLNFISPSKISFVNRTPVLESPSINSYIILAILAVSNILFIFKNKFNLKNMLIPLIILVIALFTFNHISSFITILIVFFGLLLLGRDSENKTGLVMLSWILVYLIFFSYYSIKVNRYIIPCIPPLIYLILSGIQSINEKINNNTILPVALIILFIIQAFAFCTVFEDTDEFIAPEEISNYIIHAIPDYASQMIGVYNIRPYHWYLGENITGIESDNQTKIDESNITYYISDIPQNNLNNFKEIKSIDNLYLYKKMSV